MIVESSVVVLKNFVKQVATALASRGYGKVKHKTLHGHRNCVREDQKLGKNEEDNLQEYEGPIRLNDRICSPFENLRKINTN